MTYALIVTDDRTIALSLRMMLKDSFLVEDADPSGARRAAASRRPAIVLLDTQVAGGGSLSLMRDLLADDPTLTVVVLCPSCDRRAREAVEAGAFDAIEKPFDVERAAVAVRRAAERDALQRELAALRRAPAVPPASPPRAEPDRRREFFEPLIRAIVDNFPDPRRLALEALRVFRRALGLSDMVLLLREGDVLAPAASLGADERLVREVRLPFSHPLAVRMLRRTCVIDGDRDAGLCREERDFLSLLNGRAVVPFRTFTGELIGCLVVAGTSVGGGLSADDVSSLSMCCDYLTVALDNASLYREASRQRDYQDAILSGVPCGILSVDGEGGVLVLNRAAERMLGVAAADLYGSPVEKVSSQIADCVRRAMERGEPVVREEFVHRPTGAVLGISAAALRREGGAAGAVAVFQDLAAIRAVEEKERRLERDRYWTVLASRLSHELKNPMVAIRTFAQLLPAKYEDQEFRTSFAAVVQEEIGRLNAIVEKIGRLAESQTPSAVDFDFAEILGSVVRYAERRLGPGGARCRAPARSIPVSGDPLKLQEALEYVVDYAAEGTGEGLSAELDAGIDGGRLAVSVLVAGVSGVPENPEDLFAPFADCVRSTVSIGLLLARKIAESHGGGLSAVREPAGIRFVMSLPVESHETSPHR